MLFYFHKIDFAYTLADDKAKLIKNSFSAAFKSQKAFRKERIIDFLNEKGIALFDTATAVRRLQDNASDKYLEVVRPTDISALLQQLPQCKAIVTTGQKATDTLCALFSLQEPKASG